MSLVLRTRGWLLDRHCSVALTEWDLDQELRLQTTTDQDDRATDTLLVQRPSSRTSRRKDDFIWYDKVSDSFVKPNLWLMVNPNIACPVHYETPPPPALTPLPPAHKATPPEHQTTPLPPGSHDALPQEEVVCCSSTNRKTVSEAVKSRRKPRTSSKRSDSRWRPGCGSWPRPPVNYCVLIGLALKCNGSLRVQQIYSFTRDLFPFFQSAPDGWKNTIRHNLCFNNSFRKTLNLQPPSTGTQLICPEGKRKSCCWHLTPDGHQRLRDELETLTTQTLTQLEQSAANPGNANPRPGLCPLFYSPPTTHDHDHGNILSRLRAFPRKHFFQSRKLLVSLPE
uniref:Fork-head domain-containing protein n=1 Tax=Neogobius melanostomus TaxID=47308 RepID=A0A8C6WQF6_9GOBI